MDEKQLIKTISGLNRCFVFDAPFYHALNDVLIEYPGLWPSLTDGLCPAKERTANVSGPVKTLVLQHVFYRTCRFNKIFEKVTHGNIAAGLPLLSIPPSGLSAPTIQRAMAQLSAAGYLLKIDPRFSNYSIYGLNLYPLLQLVEIKMWRQLREAAESRANPIKTTHLTAKTIAKLATLIKILEPYKGMFELLRKLYGHQLADSKFKPLAGKLDRLRAKAGKAHTAGCDLADCNNGGKLKAELEKAMEEAGDFHGFTL